MGKTIEQRKTAVEWPTVALILLCYGLWASALWGLPAVFAVPVLAVIIVLHASLQHEVIHGHPFARQWLNDLLIWPPLTLAIPYLRFKQTHLAHHRDAVITDPYDDPESNYLDQDTWDRLAPQLQWILRVNNTIAGRLVLGPLIGTVAFIRNDWRTGSFDTLRGWVIHLPAVAVVVAFVLWSPLPFWAYVVAAYLALSLLKLRSYLEHRAHDRACARSVIVERAGLLGLLFLNNNLHVVHHMHPRIAWYDLPTLYQARKADYLRRNGGYFYRSYGQIIRRYLFWAKDPVAHPLWRRRM